MSSAPPNGHAIPLPDLAQSQQRLQAQPFTRLLGARLVAVGDGSCELEIAMRDDLKQQYGFLHGGVVCYAADNALTIAAFRALGRSVVTAELKINYLRPAIGEAIVARAHVIHAGRTQVVSRCDVFAVSNGAEKLCAAAQGTISVLAEPA